MTALKCKDPIESVCYSKFGTVFVKLLPCITTGLDKLKNPDTNRAQFVRLVQTFLYPCFRLMNLRFRIWLRWIILCFITDLTHAVACTTDAGRTDPCDVRFQFNPGLIVLPDCSLVVWCWIVTLLNPVSQWPFRRYLSALCESDGKRDILKRVSTFWMIITSHILAVG